MNIKSRLLLGLFALLVILLMWYFLAFAEITYLPETYEFQAEFYGETNYKTSLESDLKKVQQIDSLRYSVISVDGDILSIKSTLESRERTTNDVTWVSELDYVVDRKTKKHVEHHEGYLTFPNNVQKQNYEFFHPLIVIPSTFVFEKEIIKNDLKLYVFTCDSKRNDISYTYPQFAPKTVYNDATCEVWVEPVTGQEVFLAQTWDNYFLEGDLKIQVETGGDQITPYSTITLIHLAKDKKQLFYFYETLIPILIIISYVSILTGILLFTEKIKNEYIHKQKTIQLESTINQHAEQTKREKLISIGYLSSRLAHDLRNPLSIIQATLDNLKMMYGTDGEKERQFEKMGRSIDRMVHQVDDVLNFVKEKPVKLFKTNTTEIILESFDSLIIPNTIKINLPENTVDIICDKKQLAIVLNNLILNGIQAVNDMGIITIGVKETADSIIFEVEDSGKGIPKETLDKIFEPLFTTKQQGTGLGLASVKTIIESHGGSISVTSPPTIFTITLPKIQD